MYLPSPRGAFRVWQRDLTVFGKFWKAALFPNFIEPFFYLAALGLGLGAFVQDINGQDYLYFIAPGLLASNAMFAASFEATFNTYVKFRINRVYDAIISTPVNAEDVVFGEYLWAGTRAAVYGSAFLLVLVVLGLVTSPWALLLPPFIFLMGLMFSVMGMLFTSLIRSIDFYAYYFTLVITPMFLFSGIFFPLEDFPAPVPQLAWFMPLYHAVNVCRELATGPSLSVLWDLAWILVFTAALSLIPVQIMRRRLVD
ncbi:ABC-2 type transporter [Rubrobacter radiotolerans]|uniref:Transport permease protein n=1 Tax=Rubrobacter radiotolerans TaxID=42256 RepID=A0A023X2E4_RUBRA|nr:ABC transporter permease [Rubrobacter radiotolerans]AHY46391.1 ABC-2 type transporter [Rubrobacter radiotolerans]MDX5893798.1 ABC transporter permease [Rubrobacter radiotolerans]SMC04520.1 lipooligosaccharide transport system permease protein [Rubrobacter radiotolerans DSM 5868]